MAQALGCSRQQFSMMSACESSAGYCWQYMVHTLVDSASDGHCQQIAGCLPAGQGQSADNACLEYDVDNLVEPFHLPQQLQGAEDP